MAHSGDRIAKQYVLEKEISNSKNSQVFSAHDEKNNLRVAIKIIAKSKVSNQDRLLQVSQTLSQIDHPNVLRVYASGVSENGDTYIVTELLDGFLLNMMIPKDVGIGLSEAWPIIAQIASGLMAAHKSGLLHLDLKPSNIFVSHKDGDEVIKIIDFGISQFISSEQEPNSWEHPFGTPGYIATELINRSQAASAQSDVYALGALLAFMLSGRRPFSGSTPQEILQNQLSGNIAVLDSLHIAPSKALQELIRKASLEPSKRFTSVEAFLNALSEIHRQQITIPDSENATTDEPAENLTEFGLGRFLIASVVLTLVGLTLLLYFWLISGN